jgi:hypothetical protein
MGAYHTGLYKKVLDTSNLRILHWAYTLYYYTVGNYGYKDYYLSYFCSFHRILVCNFGRILLCSFIGLIIIILSE